MFHHLPWRRAWRKRLQKIGFRKVGNSSSVRAKILRGVALLAFFSVLFLALVSSVLFAWYAKDLPRPDRVVRREGFATQILDREGKLLWDVYREERRIPVALDQVPVYLRQAVIAVEDKDFYTHEGFDPRGILRAVKNIILYRRLQGGSTLTQQLLKNVLLTSERTLPRKIKEFLLSVQIERRFSKDEILTMYLNEAPFGANPKAYLGRTREVLRRMREDGYINKDQEQEAETALSQITFAPTDTSILAPHFVMYVREKLAELYGDQVVEQGGLRVTTSLDLTLQEKAQQFVSEEISKVTGDHITNGAAVVMDPRSGEILAMVGSKDFWASDYDGQVNVSLALRQPGSAIKPVTYATAFGRG